MMVAGIRGEHMRLFSLLLSISLVTASPALAQDWSPRPWLGDLAQAQQAFATKYANIEWLEADREMPLIGLFDKAASRLGSARSDAEARAVFDRLIERVGDGHVSIEWPRSAATQPASVAAPAKQFDACDDLGFDQGRSTLGTAAYLPGYRAMGASSPFPAGVISVGVQTVGVIRIGGFEPQGSPPICRAALQALRRSADKPCDDKCQDAILTWAYIRLTAALEEQVRKSRFAYYGGRVRRCFWLISPTMVAAPSGRRLLHAY